MRIVSGSSPREVVPLLLEELQDRDPYWAGWINDVYSEVLRGLRQNNVKDPEMVNWLMEALECHLRPTAPEGTWFGERAPGEWGFWPHEPVSLED